MQLKVKHAVSSKLRVHRWEEEEGEVEQVLDSGLPSCGRSPGLAAGAQQTLRTAPRSSQSSFAPAVPSPIPDPGKPCHVGFLSGGSLR